MTRRQQRLIDVARQRAEKVRCMELVHVPLDACPMCGGPLVDETVTEMPLLRHGGYGANRTSTRRYCLCGWALTVEVSETRPERRSA